MRNRAIVIGDSTNNTLSIIRSLGEAGIDQVLILKCDVDVHFVATSKYLKDKKVYHVISVCDIMPILDELSKEYAYENQYIICSFDEAAMYIDENEQYLSAHFYTPARGNRIGALFNKEEQCLLAEKCGLTVPSSKVFVRQDIRTHEFTYPILLKPLYSTQGEKSDIHICHDLHELEMALNNVSYCENFIIQEFIDKEYELDCIGVRTDSEVYIAGGIKKIRHYPPLIGAGAYGLFLPIDELDINIAGVTEFLQRSNYHGPFSVEFLHKGNKNYFMEVNFRNEGLAYAATVAGANLHAMYVDQRKSVDRNRVRPVYMMNYSLDYIYVKTGDISIWTWLRDLCRTKCFININWKDLSPTINYYKNKLGSRLW